MQTQQRASPGLENSNRVDKLTNKLTKPRTEWKEARAGTSGCKTTPSSRCVLEKRLQFLVSHRSGLHPRGWSTWRGLLSPQHPPGRPAAGPADPPVPLRWAKPGRAAHPRTRCQSPRGGQSRGAAPPAATPRAEPRGSPPAPPPQAAGPAGRPPRPRPRARRSARRVPGPRQAPACSSLSFPRGHRSESGGRGEADRGCGSPRERRPPFSRQRGRQKPCSGFMGPNPVRCGVWVTARRAGVSPRPRCGARGREDLASAHRTAQKKRRLRGHGRRVTSVLGSPPGSVPPGLANAAAGRAASRSRQLRRTSPA